MRAAARAALALMCASCLGVLSAGDAGGTTFGVALKGRQADGKPWPQGVEVNVLSQQCAVAPCRMTAFWAGGDFHGYERSVVRYYVDGERAASVELPFDLAFGSAGSDASSTLVPYAAGSLFGRTGEPSGIFHHFQIPFSRSVRVAVRLNAEGAGAGAGAGAGEVRFWIILRGQQGAPLQGLPAGVPASARARSVTAASAALPSLALHEVARSTAFRTAVLTVTLSVEQHEPGSPVFLEGCFRVHDLDSRRVRLVLSSGTEDYFLGTYYFNRGKYATAVAGYTNDGIQRAGSNRTFTAYRVHDHFDPLVLDNAHGGFLLTWRNSDPDGCPDPAAPASAARKMPWFGGPAAANAEQVVSVRSFALLYEWDAIGQARVEAARGQAGVEAAL
jgi:hypothetical protein